LIKEQTIKGSKDTSFHDFQLNVSGLVLTLSNGSYFRAGQEIFKDNEITVVNIPVSANLIYYELWITNDGLCVLTRKENEDFPYEQMTNQIDRLCWFYIPANCMDLNAVDINFIKVVE
jgi:hypothetical protein